MKNMFIGKNEKPKLLKEMSRKEIISTVLACVLSAVITVSAMAGVVSIALNITAKADDDALTETTYDPYTTLVDTNGKTYVWIGEDTYARPDTYEENIHSVEWRKHIREDHPLGYRTIFKWDCPTCLTNLVSEQNIVTNDETTLTYKGINMAMKRIYTEMSYGYGNTVKDPPQIEFEIARYWNTSGALITSSAEQVGFLQGGTQEQAVVQTAVNYGKVMGFSLVFIGVVPSTANNDSCRLVIGYVPKSNTRTIECGTDDVGTYIHTTAGSTAIRFVQVNDNGFAPNASTVSLTSQKQYFATTTTNTVSVQNTRLIYYNPTVDDTIRNLTGTTLANTPTAYTSVYDPLEEAKITGTKYVKYSTTAYPNIGPNTNQTFYAYWMLARMVGNYGVISGGTSEDDAQSYIEQGRQEVITNPNAYNLYTATQYSAMRTTGRNDVLNNLVNPPNWNLRTYTDYIDYGIAQYNKGLEDAGTGSGLDMNMKHVVDAILQAPNTVVQSVSDGLDSPTEELFGFKISNVWYAVVVIGLACALIAIVKKMG